MYTLEVKKLFILCGVMSLGFSVAYGDLQKNIDGSVIYPSKDGKYADYHISTQKIDALSYGRAPTANEIKAWDTDVMPDGHGLPEGQGSVEEGDELYANECAVCHGEFGIGGKGYPTLSGGQGTLKNQLLKPGDPAPIRTIGSYWPYASTLFWYIKTAMPFPHPKSLSDSEVYAITAYLLSINDIEVDGESIDDEFVLSKENFMKIQMPNKDGFYPVDPSRNDLKEMRPPLAQGERCMKDCKAPKPVHIQNEITGFDPPISTKKDLPQVKTEEKASNFDAKIIKAYQDTCSACHENAAIGAPLLGDKEAWKKVTSKGLDAVYKNAINGINAMPPKGGNMDLGDDEFKKVINYMIEKSK